MAIRTRFDAKTKEKERLLLVAAVSPNQDHYQYLSIADMDPLLDYWVMMGYDYSGSFSRTSAHASNIYASNSSNITPFSTHDGIVAYKKYVNASKMVLGMPLHAHDFLNTDGLGYGYSGNSRGSWPDPSDQVDSGVWDYKVSLSLYRCTALIRIKSLPSNETSIVSADKNLVASWAYCGQSRKLVSFDSPQIARLKAEYIMKPNLWGAMWWEISGDKPSGDTDSLIDSVLGVLGSARPPW